MEEWQGPFGHCLQLVRHFIGSLWLPKLTLYFRFALDIAFYGLGLNSSIVVRLSPFLQCSRALIVLSQCS